MCPHPASPLPVGRPRPLAALALILGAATAPLLAAPAQADCRAEVLAALDKQRKSAAFRMDSTMVSEKGPMRMVVDYRQPDRMRQVVSLAISPGAATETILVGSTAWSREGTGTWVPLSPEITREIASQRDEILGDDAGTIGTVACLGSTAIDGRELVAYRIESDAQVGPKDMSPDAKEKAAAALADAGRPLRMFYVDPKTGLPARSVFARADKLDRPIFRADYAYDPAITIDPPK